MHGKGYAKVCCTRPHKDFYSVQPILLTTLWMQVVLNSDGREQLVARVAFDFTLPCDAHENCGKRRPVMASLFRVSTWEFFHCLTEIQ